MAWQGNGLGAACCVKWPLMVHTGTILPIQDFYITLRFIAHSTHFNIFISEYQTAEWVNCHPPTHLCTLSQLYNTKGFRVL